ncbi:MAG: SagB/ThcOx family dehydrogenase [Tannerella sp.]|jgi:SagB-type dehydrogenase family enzyme|nr:SagB/ThcOx family dehydrogenase [Tannerella sp.]
MDTKKFFIALIACFTVANIYAQELQVIKLNAPDKTRGSATMKAFSDRHSDREFSSQELSLQDLSDLLWAANGVNRADGKRTAPTAMNRQEIDVYAIRADGAYLYDAQNHSLKPVAKGDYRTAVAGKQDYVISAPVSLVTVINLEKLGDPATEQTKLMGAVDAGIVTQNINIFCAAAGLSTVPRASMDQAELKKVLKLSDTQLPLMNNPVGYPKK